MDNSEFIMDESAIVPDMKCNVCGETEFDLQEGYYNCRECGTVAEQVRLIEVEDGADHETGKFSKKTTIKVKVEDELKLTSWECYNYILRGFVEDLIMFGAKEELKLMTLQVWAAYLRRMEVAFFNKKHAELPHLGILYLEKDAEILYNQQRIRKRKRRHTDDSVTSSEIGGRKHRKNLRKLDESIYSIASQADESSIYQSSFRTSESSISTDTTSRAIHIQFAYAAKKIYKSKKRKQSNLCKQTGNSKSSTKNQVKIMAKELNTSTKKTHTLNIKQLYAILAISLNLIEDDIQLSDLTRFIADDHISSKNVANYFPENLKLNIKNILSDIKFFHSPDKFNYEYLREHVSYLSRFLNIREFKMPNISSLIERYITELNLPAYLGVLIKRLVNLLPPNMCTRRNQMYPPFEARAMAYIVFVLKLIFGLDGEKEKLISESAQKINEKLNSLSTDKSKPLHADLFVWSEWVQYIEMRKVILSQVNLNFAQQFGCTELKTELFIAKLQRDEHRKDDEDMEFNTSNPNSANTKKLNIRTIFSNLFSKLSKKPNEVEAFTMKPNFTPAHTYLQRILLNNCNSNDSFFSNHIPEFMHVNHGQRDIESFLCEKTLHNCLAKHNIWLNVESLNCNSNNELVGIFYIPLGHKSQILKADFNISEEEWKENINKTYKLDDIDFKTEYETYNARYMYQLKKRYGSNFEITTTRLNGKKKQLIKTENTSHQNADDNIFTDMSNGNNTENDNQIQKERSMDQETALNWKNAKDVNIMTLHTSKMDYWELIGSATTLVLMTDTQKQNFTAKFPLSFFWLLETCAQTIQVDWAVLYEQLLAIEVMFGHGLKNLDNFTNCLHYKYDVMAKDINLLVNQYREIW